MNWWPKIAVGFTWDQWGFLWNNEGGDYVSIGIGPLFIQLDWSGEVL
jgi:hypothetical protein